MPDYLVYGLKLRSDTSIPALAPRPDLAGAVDVEVRFEPAANGPDRAAAGADDWYVRGEQGEDPSLLIRRGNVDGELLLFYSDGVRFRLDAAGTAVTAWRPDRLTIDDVAVYLIGPVLGILLRLRCALCLHGSAVEVSGAAVGFIGPPGAGKSSTAAALAQCGRRVLSDDLLVLHRDGDRFRAQPGYPSVRLWPASVSALYGSPDAMPPIVAGWDKRYVDLVAGDAYAEQPLGLAAIYALGERRPALTRTTIEPLSQGQGLLELTANAFAGYLPRGPRQRRDEFQALSELSAAVPVRRMLQGERWQTIRDLPETLHEDLLELAP